MLHLDELEQCAISFNEIDTKLKRLMSYYESKCNDLLSKLKYTSFSESDMVFNDLFAIQTIFAKLKYRYCIEMNNFFENFIYYFDRQDEINKEFLYEHFHVSENFPE